MASGRVATFRLVPGKSTVSRTAVVIPMPVFILWRCQGLSGPRPCPGWAVGLGRANNFGLHTVGTATHDWVLVRLGLVPSWLVGLATLLHRPTQGILRCMNVDAVIHGRFLHLLRCRSRVPLQFLLACFFMCVPVLQNACLANFTWSLPGTLMSAFVEMALLTFFMVVDTSSEMRALRRRSLRRRTVVMCILQLGNYGGTKHGIEFVLHQNSVPKMPNTSDRLTRTSSATSCFFPAYVNSCLGWQLVQLVERTTVHWRGKNWSWWQQISGSI